MILPNLVQVILCYETTLGTTKKWSFVRGGLSLEVIYYINATFCTSPRGCLTKGGLSIEGLHNTGSSVFRIILPFIGNTFSDKKIEKYFFSC